ncbi:MAG: hypothetical protein GX446_12675 [Chthonomonadales bacterium]|nr:hypothetical protein [Chthonomonadales bacterium]
MNGRIQRFSRDFSYAALSSLIAAAVSVLSVLILPKFLGLEDYGYLALFLFYASYVPVLQLGWTDGIYLRFGGVKYEELDRSAFSSQFLLLLISQGSLGLLLAAYAVAAPLDTQREFLLATLAGYMVLVNARFFFTYIMQASGRFREYARVTVSDRLIYLSIVTVLIAAGEYGYRNIVYADLVAKTASLIGAIYLCRTVVFARPTRLHLSLNEARRNIFAGAQIMFSNTSNMLILGVVRYSIDRTFGVVAFGKMALALNVTSFLMVLINATGMVLFPLLRRAAPSRLPAYYIAIRTLLMPALLGSLLLFYPVNAVLSVWLPAYGDSLRYLSIVFPVVVFEARMALLVNTYFKTVRAESILLAINAGALLISGALAYFSTSVVGSLDVAALSIVAVLGLRSTIAELTILRIIRARVSSDLWIEIFMVSLFIAANWFAPGFVHAFLYTLSFAVLLLLKRNEIRETARWIFTGDS